MKFNHGNYRSTVIRGRGKNGLCSATWVRRTSLLKKLVPWTKFALQEKKMVDGRLNPSGERRTGRPMRPDASLGVTLSTEDSDNELDHNQAPEWTPKALGGNLSSFSLASCLPAKKSLAGMFLYVFNQCVQHCARDVHRPIGTSVWVDMRKSNKFYQDLILRFVGARSEVAALTLKLLRRFAWPPLQRERERVPFDAKISGDLCSFWMFEH